MNLADLVRALLAFDALAARQWVADSMRQGLVWASVPEPTGLDAVGMGVAAGVAELLAGRAGQEAPAWAKAVGAGGCARRRGRSRSGGVGSWPRRSS